MLYWSRSSGKDDKMPCATLAVVFKKEPRANAYLSFLDVANAVAGLYGLKLGKAQRHYAKGPAFLLIK
jgi:hypothetical protein